MPGVMRGVDQKVDVPDPDSEAATEIVPLDMKVESAASQVELTQIGDYLVETVIGEGGGGRVYSARRRGHGQRVAIKVLRPEMVPLPHLVVRFNREIDAINRIRHPNIVRIIECGETEHGQPYYVMELLEGVNLRRLLQLHGRFSPHEVLELIEPVCRALQAVHDAGFVHRDIKASNVLVVDGLGERSVKLLDFGIAKTVHGEVPGQGLTEPGVKLGSVHNMAPEQIRCERLDARADLYALGVVIYQLLTGEYPFHAAEPHQIALMHLQAPAPRPSSRTAVPPAVDAIVLRCLEKQPERRFYSADELLATLRAALGEPARVEDEQERTALGIYIEAGPPPDVELDDDMIEDVSNVLDLVEQRLVAQGFEFPLRTSNALLGVQVMASAAVSQRERDQASATAKALSAELRSRPYPHAEVEVRISARADVVRCRAGSEISGGALLELEAWTSTHRVA